MRAGPGFWCTRGGRGMLMAVGSDETARLADVGARWLAGKALSALTEGISADAAADLTKALALAGRIIERETTKSSASASSTPHVTERPASARPSREGGPTALARSERPLRRWEIRTNQSRTWAIVAIVISVAAIVLWATRWQYYGQRVGKSDIPASVRVNRWTGAREVFRCSLTAQGGEEVRGLQAELVKVMAGTAYGAASAQGPPLPSSGGVPSFQTGQGAPAAGRGKPRGILDVAAETNVAQFWPCATCPIDFAQAERVARAAVRGREPPFGNDPHIRTLLERLDTAKAAHWKCGWR